jgi:hypothetical protein
MTEKNYTKYYSYKIAFDRISDSIKSGFFLEAIAIEESILCDRLFPFARLGGIKKPIEKSTLGPIINAIKSREDEIALPQDFLDKISRWGDSRNTCLHQIVKSNTGEPTIEIKKFLENAKNTAEEGLFLAKEIIKLSKKRSTTIPLENLDK